MNSSRVILIPTQVGTSRWSDREQLKLFFFNNGPSSFSFIFVFSNKLYNFLQQINVKRSIQYKALGFEPTTFKREYLPITTRLGLPPNSNCSYLVIFVTSSNLCQNFKDDDSVLEGERVRLRAQNGFGRHLGQFFVSQTKQEIFLFILKLGSFKTRFC